LLLVKITEFQNRTKFALPPAEGIADNLLALEALLSFYKFFSLRNLEVHRFFVALDVFLFDRGRLAEESI
jgi:hypothetical protein